MKTPLGSIIDGLVDAPDLNDGDLISDVVVVLKVIPADSMVPRLLVSGSDSTDWVTRMGMLHAAKVILDSELSEGDED